MDIGATVGWVVSRIVALAVGGGCLVLAYRAGIWAVGRFVPQVLHAQAAHLPAGSASAEEVDKRIGTIADLLRRLLRLAFLALLLALVLVVFDLWPILLGIVLVVIAVTFASQEVVLDYVMGLLILVEGPFYKGDWVQVTGSVAAEGTVEEIGLRRTVLRDPMGASHAVSNGLIRASSNQTRAYSVATVETQVLRASQLEAAIEVVSRVARTMRDDPDWAERFPEGVGTDVWVMGLSVDGADPRVLQKVAPGTHGPVASELRRRIAAELVAAGIGTGRWDTPLPISTTGGSVS